MRELDVDALRKRAEGGDIDAQWALARCYAEGKGVLADLFAAVRWYQAAALHHHVGALYHLAVCYERGDGVDHNFGEALRLYREAAALGHPWAQYNLGFHCERGSAGDRAQALAWYRKAAEQGDVDAARALARLCPREVIARSSRGSFRAPRVETRAKLEAWRLQLLKKHKVRSFSFIAYLDNLESILAHGILPKNEVERRGLSHRSFAEEAVQARREARHIYLSDHTTRCGVHDLVPVYLCPRTPTLYSRRSAQRRLCSLRIDARVIGSAGIEFAFTDGNAASHASRYYTDLRNLDRVSWDCIRAESWVEFPDGKRRRNAEFLIHPGIEPRWIAEIGVSHSAALVEVQRVMERRERVIPASVKQKWFF